MGGLHRCADFTRTAQTQKLQQSNMTPPSASKGDNNENSVQRRLKRTLHSERAEQELTIWHSESEKLFSAINNT